MKIQSNPSIHLSVSNKAPQHVLHPSVIRFMCFHLILSCENQIGSHGLAGRLAAFSFKMFDFLFILCYVGGTYLEK